MKKDVLVLFGGESAEHEVSVVTGLQVVEKIDRERYDVLSVYVSKKGELFLMPDLKTRKEFTSARRVPIAFGKDADG
ncbi:MAG: D-alanine--D-alanine ligase, partial [Patescibacteria group bacterium]